MGAAAGMAWLIDGRYDDTYRNGYQQYDRHDVSGMILRWRVEWLCDERSLPARRRRGKPY